MIVAWNPGRDPGWSPEPGLEGQARALHHALPGYAPTPLLTAPSLAAELDLGAVLLKDESSRFGLPAFKALGAWWAAAWAVAGRLGAPELASDPVALRERAAAGPPLSLACATEGNHGRAVARIARELGLGARVSCRRGRRTRACGRSRTRARAWSASTATTTRRSSMPPGSPTSATW